MHGSTMKLSMLTVFRVVAWVGREFRASGLRAQFFHQRTLAATIALGSLALLLLCLTERPLLEDCFAAHCRQARSLMAAPRSRWPPLLG